MKEVIGFRRLCEEAYRLGGEDLVRNCTSRGSGSYHYFRSWLGQRIGGFATGEIGETRQGELTIDVPDGPEGLLLP